MKPLPVPSIPLADAAAAAVRAAQWLGNRWRRAPVEDGGLAIDALALAHVCRVVIGAAECPAADDAEAAIAEAAADLPWAKAHLSAGLLAAAAARRLGGDAARSAGAYRRALEGLDETDLGGANGVLVRFALQRPAPASGERPRLDPTGLLRPDRLRAFLGEIEAATSFGTAAIAVAQPVPALLEGAAIAALRAYDLPLGMRILRARAYLGNPGSYGSSAGLDFLRLLQGEDGSFGDFDTALARLAAEGERHGELSLKLPVTLQAIWTMAELEDPGFRLVRAAFRDPDANMRGGGLHVVQQPD